MCHFWTSTGHSYVSTHMHLCYYFHISDWSNFKLSMNFVVELLELELLSWIYLNSSCLWTFWTWTVVLDWSKFKLYASTNPAPLRQGGCIQVWKSEISLLLPDTSETQCISMNGKLPKMVKIPSAQWEKPNTIIPNSAKERFVFSTTTKLSGAAECLNNCASKFESKFK